LLVPRGDANAAGEALARLLRNDAQRAAFGEAGRERALAHFTQERMHRAWARLYHDAVRAR
jgi:glycosyltransferase involved in cell wall biosynthesis